MFRIIQPSKHSSWWRRAEDVFKTSSRRLQCNIFLSSKTSSRHNCKTSCKHVLKTSWRRLARRLEDISGRRIVNTSSRRFQEVLEDRKCWAEDVLENKKCLLGGFQICQVSVCASVTGSKFYGVLNMPPVLNILRLGI